MNRHLLSVSADFGALAFDVEAGVGVAGALGIVKQTLGECIAEVEARNRGWRHRRRQRQQVAQAALDDEHLELEI